PLGQDVVRRTKRAVDYSRPRSDGVSSARHMEDRCGPARTAAAWVRAAERALVRALGADDVLAAGSDAVGAIRVNRVVPGAAGDPVPLAVTRVDPIVAGAALQVVDPAAAAEDVI